MEKDYAHERHISHDSPILTPEQLALEALVDALFRRADAGAFLILNKIAEEAHNE